MKHLRIGTRGSLLAKWQAEFVRRQVFQATGVEGEIVIIKTSGDKMAQTLALRNRRKGNLRQRARRSPARRFHRHRRPQRERHPDARLRPASRFPRFCAAKTFATASSPTMAPTSPAFARARASAPAASAVARSFSTFAPIWTSAISAATSTRAFAKSKAASTTPSCSPKPASTASAATHRITEVFAPEVFLARCRSGRHRRRMPRRRRRNLRRSRKTRRRRNAQRDHRRTHPALRALKVAARFRSAHGPASIATNSSSTPASAASTARNTSSNAPPLRPIKLALSASAWPNS